MSFETPPRWSGSPSGRVDDVFEGTWRYQLVAFHGSHRLQPLVGDELMLDPRGEDRTFHGGGEVLGGNLAACELVGQPVEMVPTQQGQCVGAAGPRFRTERVSIEAGEDGLGSGEGFGEFASQLLSPLRLEVPGECLALTAPVVDAGRDGRIGRRGQHQSGRRPWQGRGVAAVCCTTNLLGPVQGIQDRITVCLGALVEGTEKASVSVVVLRERGLGGAGGERRRPPLPWPATG
jgi:hypothetical protein